MKPATNTPPTWDLATVQQVHKEFLRNKDAQHLCHGSKTFVYFFEHAPSWSKIKAAAKAYLAKKHSDLTVGESYLFLGYGNWNRRQVRLAFLRHEIKRLKNLNATTP